MKILHVFKTYHPDEFGGIQTCIDQLSSALVQYDVSSEVFTLTKDITRPLEMEINNCKVHRVPQSFEVASCPFSFSALSRFSELVEKADIVHYQFPWPFADMLHFMARVKKPSLVTYQSDVVKQTFWLKLYAPLMHAFLKSVDRIVTTSPNYLATSPVLKKYSDKVSVIPIGLNQANYSAPSNEKLNYWRQKFSERFFLFIGALRYYKGLEYLLEVAKNINAPILIVGTGSPLQESLKAQAAQLGLKNIHFLGKLDEIDKMALLSICYAFVFPSHLRSEAFGISLLEAAMSAKPLISCEIGTGTSYINISGETGLVIPPADPIELAKAMQFLLDHPEQAYQMGEAARQRYLNVFTAEKMGFSYTELYKQLLPLP